MNGHPRKRGSKWELVLELGDQAARQCPVCRRAPRYWTDAGTPKCCPK